MAKPFIFAAFSMTSVIIVAFVGINCVINAPQKSIVDSTEYQKSRAELIQLMNQ